ncbi:adenylate guanylate cyclase [Chlorella sorokiniana]|uniref:Adenylate guanylate cyclase n=1 Tax=Chlorella sorokiniana TaxID=3076 RepID=A0A2P6TCA3_CHLSO|nr:adenylate guanylate cyclase [Chlorella sorokiniana]|eukprot:PRW20259.1 adenylate guanylate cyclase [Chlorella sorokiniana]
MQAVAQVQAASGHKLVACPGSGQADESARPFATLSVWREKIQADLAAAGDKGGPTYKLRLLLEQGKDVEQAVLGCLKDALFELHEGVDWGLLDPEYERQQRQQLVLELAREHGLLEQYAAEIKKPINRTLADYERVGELKFGLLVWRANLKRDVSLLAGGAEGGGGGDPQALEAHLREAYQDALRLIQRCGTKSLAFWAAQRAGAAPTQDSKQRLYQAAMQRVRNGLLEVAAALPGVASDGLERMFGELSDPDAVEAEAGDSGEAEAGALPTASRGSSEESETSALGL